MELVKIVCAIIFPPVAAFLQVGFGKHFWINILLTILGIVPGMVHAVWIIVKNKS
ncbi:YqaE/Pmp3 family membrane protein [Desulfogranum mediterraneum]|uniref:YqaE/Pmp3 family membrane protein n=1 Tax=Desulfogranum mediterraneum TaxID=160661 RepID=UPI000408109D|nr:YqaE/Pmp3 family membrane protein [Desulfogranum mediterraneum]